MKIDIETNPIESEKTEGDKASERVRGLQNEHQEDVAFMNNLQRELDDLSQPLPDVSQFKNKRLEALQEEVSRKLVDQKIDLELESVLLELKKMSEKGIFDKAKMKQLKERLEVISYKQKSIATNEFGEEEARRIRTKANKRVRELVGLPPVSVQTKVKYGESTKSQEIDKIIEFNFEEQLQRWTTFYTTNNIPLPDNFEETMTDIWERNEGQMKESIEQQGYDEILLIPPIASLPHLHTKMTEGYNPTYQSVNFRNGGSFEGAITENQDKPQIVLVHKENAENIYNNPNAPTIIIETLGKSIDQLNQAKHEGLSLIHYLIYQRIYHEETTNHLDEQGYTWTPKTKVTGGSVSRFVCSDWFPGGGRLHAYALGSGSAGSDLCSRPSRSFK